MLSAVLDASTTVFEVRPAATFGAFLEGSADTDHPGLAEDTVGDGARR